MVKNSSNNFRLENINGVGPTKMKRMEEHGIKFIQDICMCGAEELHRITNLDVDACAELLINARKALEKFDVIRPMRSSAREDLEYERALPTLSSKCEAIDILFGGYGPKKETLTEVYGEYGSGKTQYLISCMVEILLQGKDVVIVDCEGTYSSERLLEVAYTRGYVDEDDNEEQMKFIEKLEIIRTTNSTETYKAIYSITEIALGGDLGLVVIDGAIGQIRKEYLARGELSERQAYLKPMMARLGAMPTFLSCWVFMTNQVYTSPGEMFSDPVKPVGGAVVGHEATFRMYFKKTGKRTWMAEMVDSPKDAKMSVPFILTGSGVSDNEEKLKDTKKILCEIKALSIVRSFESLDDNKLMEKINKNKKILFYNIGYEVDEIILKKLRKEIKPKKFKSSEISGELPEDTFVEKGLKDTSLLLNTDKEFTLSN